MNNLLFSAIGHSHVLIIMLACQVVINTKNLLDD